MTANQINISSTDIDNLSISKTNVISKTPQPKTPQKLTKLNAKIAQNNNNFNNNNSPNDKPQFSQSQPNLQNSENNNNHIQNDININSNSQHNNNNNNNNNNMNDDTANATITGAAYNYATTYATSAISYISSFYPPTEPTQPQNALNHEENHENEKQATKQDEIYNNLTQHSKSLPPVNKNGCIISNGTNGTNATNGYYDVSIPDKKKYPMTENESDASNSNLPQLLDNVSASGIDVPWTKQFSEPLLDTVLLRSLTYKIDGKKQIDSGLNTRGLPIFRLAHVQSFRTELLLDNVAMHPLSWYNQNISLDDMSTFTMIVQLQVKSLKTSFITYHVLTRSGFGGYNSNGTPIIKGDKAITKLFDLILRSVDANDTTTINNRLKLIPRVVSGPYPVKRVVENRPVLLGNKVTQRYFRGSNYFEIDSRVDESVVASSIIKLCHRFAKRIVVDMAWTIQGEEMDELPERLLCGCTIHNMDFSKCKDMQHEMMNCPKLIYNQQKKNDSYHTNTNTKHDELKQNK